MTIVWITILSLLSGLCYRLGGWGEPGRIEFPKLPGFLFNTKMRDLGCPLISLLAVILLGVNVPWYIHFISFGLMFGALTTYWDRVFGFDNFWFHGFMVAVAYFPYAIITDGWMGWSFRTFVLAILIGGWSLLIKYDVLEELGRGFFIVSTLPLMILGV